VPISPLILCLTKLLAGLNASGNLRGGAFRQAAWPAVPVDSFPDLQTMDGNLGIDLEAQSHAPAFDLEHRDFEHAMETIGPSDHNRFPSFPRQH
jgi:hypothetical protein